MGVAEDFTAELVRAFGSGHSAQWNDTIKRWEIVSPSALGKPVVQVWGWLSRRNALGVMEPIEPGPDGLPPFRDLDAASRAEILRHMQQSFTGDPTKHAHAISRENRETKAKQRARRAVLHSELMAEVRIAGRWKLDHPRNQGPPVYSLPSS